MADATRFSDVAQLPAAAFAVGGLTRTVEYAMHHVISNEAFERSDLLKALQSRGLWSQDSYRTNGVALVWRIDGVLASQSPVRDIVGGATHTGGHSNYNAAQRKLFDAFDEKYSLLQRTQQWGSFGSEEGWLTAQAKVINGYAATLKVELSNPESGLKLNTKDKSRLSIDIESRELWSKFQQNLFDAETLTFASSITDHPAYVAGSKLGAGAIDATPGSGSALDISRFASSSDVSNALSSQYGIGRSTASFFTKATIHQTLDLTKKGHSLVITGLAITGIVALVFQQQEAMAADLGRQVSFDEARKALGIELTEQALRNLGGEAAFNAAVSMALPFGWAKQVWDLLLSGEDVLSLIRLYGEVYPTSDVLEQLNKMADAIEQDSGYRSYKDNKEALKAWMGRLFSDATSNSADGANTISFSYRSSDWDSNVSADHSVTIKESSNGSFSILAIEKTADGRGTATTYLGDKSIVGTYVRNDAGEWVLSSWQQNGLTSAGSDVAGFIASLQAGFDAINSANAYESASAVIGSRFAAANAASGPGMQEAANNSAALTFLAKRLNLTNEPNNGYAAIRLSGDIPPTYLLSGVMTAAVRQAQEQAAQARISSLLGRPSIVDVQVISFGGGFSFPLVLDLDDRGVDLVAIDKSTATFDTDLSGRVKPIGWVGRSSGILVFDKNGNGVIDNAGEWFGEQFSVTGLPGYGQRGFGALATLAQAGATVFSRNTSAIDAKTGKLYFDEVKVWVDANQDGRSGVGELRTLAELGIESIDLVPEPVHTISAGNLVDTRAGYTTTDGKRHVIQDVGLSTAPLVPILGAQPANAAKLAFAEYTSKGYAAMATGQASAIVTALANDPMDVSGPLASLNAWMSQTRFKMFSEGTAIRQYYTKPGLTAPIYTWYTNTTVGFPASPILNYAPEHTASLLRGVSTLVQNERDTAQAIVDGSRAISAANTAAEIANATGTPQSRQTADSTANSAKVKWAQAIRGYLQVRDAVQSLTGGLDALQAELNSLVPTNISLTGHLPGGLTFVGPMEADFAAATFSAYGALLQPLAKLKAAGDQMLGAIAQSAGYTTVYAAAEGQTVSAQNGYNLMIASGNAGFVASRGVDNIALTGSGTLTVWNFAPGRQGDQIQIYNGSAALVSDDGAGGTLIRASGGGTVRLVGVRPEALDLFSNLSGVTEADFSGVGRSATRSIGYEELFDGQLHISTLRASNAGDTLVGGERGGSYYGGAGNDTFVINGREYFVDGKGGTNTVSYANLRFGIKLGQAADVEWLPRDDDPSYLEPHQVMIGQDSLGNRLFHVSNVIGTKFNDFLTGGVENNTFDGNGGNDVIDGGGGYDVVLQDGIHQNATVRWNGDWREYSVTSSAGRLTLSNIEEIRFLDGRLLTDANGLGALAYRMYNVAFGRRPDPGGLASAVALLEGGMTLKAWADSAASSGEFMAKYGTLDNRSLIETLYQNVLLRPATNEELSDRMMAMSGGMSKGELLLWFANHEQLKEMTKAEVEQGLWITDPRSLVIDRLYRTVLGRGVDLSGLESNLRLLNGGATYQQLATVLSHSPEFSGRYGSMNDAAFISLVFGQALGRGPSTTELSQYLTTISNGGTWGDVAATLASTGEAIRHLPLMNGYSISLPDNERRTVFGSAAADTLMGTSGNDVIYSGAGNDVIVGAGGDDWIDPGEGVDSVDGGAGIDTLSYASRMKLLQQASTPGAGPGGVYIQMGLGIAQEKDAAGNVVATDTFRNIENAVGTNNSDFIQGDDSDNVLYGLAGKDQIGGGAGNDIIFGGADDDLLYGQHGDDTLYGDDGNDGLWGESGNDRLFGGAGQDYLEGAAGDDYLDGGTGNDVLAGGTGNDVYRFDRGGGVDTIIENDATPGNQDVLMFGDAISENQLWFRHVGNDLEISIIGTSDKAVVRDWYLGQAYHVEELRSAGGKTLLDTQVDQLVQAMASFNPPASGQTSLPANYQTALAPVIAANWK